MRRKREHRGKAMERPVLDKMVRRVRNKAVRQCAPFREEEWPAAYPVSQK